MALLLTTTSLPPHPEKILQQGRRLGFTDGRVHLRHMMAGWLPEEPHAGFHRAALGVGRAVIEPADARERDRARAHGAGLQRDVEVAIDQPLGADDLGRLPDRHDFRMRGGIAIGQGPVGGRGDDLVIPDDDASDRHFAGFSSIFRRFQRQIHERRGHHASYHRTKPATGSAFSKRGYRFCVRLRLILSARATAMTPIHPADAPFHRTPRTNSCPATTTKTTIPAAGVIAPRVARAAPAPSAGRTRSSANVKAARRAARAKASGAPMPESPTAPNPKASSRKVPGPMPRSPMPARASLLPAIVRRAAMGIASARAGIGRSRIGQGVIGLPVIGLPVIGPRVIVRNASTGMT